MVTTTTPICNFGWKAPAFDLPATDGQRVTLQSATGPAGLLVMFICNHCPYVKAVLDLIIEDTRTLQSAGIYSVAIQPNDTVYYPEDSWDNMVRLAEAKNFPFPYLWDESQDVARAYQAQCTPDFFGFNHNLELQYRGRIISSGKTPVPGARRELLEAMQQVASTGQGPREQMPSIGCSIKWRSA